MKRIKTFINLWKLCHFLQHKPGLMKITEDIFKFIETTHANQVPMLSEIALVNMADGTKIGDFVNLWAGIGEANPIQRIMHLKAQNEALKKMLLVAINEPLTDARKKEILSIVNIFE